MAETNVTQSMFTWVVGLILTISIIIFGWLGARVTGVEARMSGVEISQATLMERMINLQATADRIDKNVNTHLNLK